MELLQARLCCLRLGGTRSSDLGFSWWSHPRGQSPGSGAREGTRLGWEGWDCGEHPTGLSVVRQLRALHPGLGPVSDSLLPPKGMSDSEGKGMDDKRAGLLKDFERKWKNTAVLLARDPLHSTERCSGP